jgi:predicted nucleic acid-binding Zn ribbon protein
MQEVPEGSQAGGQFLCGRSATIGPDSSSRRNFASNKRFKKMNAIIYLVGLVVIVMAILSFVGLN